jgi:hypothetical protein
MTRRTDAKVFLSMVKRPHRVDTQCASAWKQCSNDGDANQDYDPA